MVEVTGVPLVLRGSHENAGDVAGKQSPEACFAPTEFGAQSQMSFPIPCTQGMSAPTPPGSRVAVASSPLVERLESRLEDSRPSVPFAHCGIRSMLTHDSATTIPCWRRCSARREGSSPAPTYLIVASSIVAAHASSTGLAIRPGREAVLMPSKMRLRKCTHRCTPT